jgi:hypothetical protein
MKVALLEAWMLWAFLLSSWRSFLVAHDWFVATMVRDENEDEECYVETFFALF